MYWNNIFYEDNRKAEHVFSISGEARIFHRDKSIEEKITHPKGQYIDNKNPNEFNKKKSKFEYDLIKDKKLFQYDYNYISPKKDSKILLKTVICNPINIKYTER